MLISGNGSNLQAIIDRCADQTIAGQVVAVVSNVSSAFGLTRAANAGIETLTLDHSAFESRSDYDQALEQALDEFAPDLIVLAGFMRILTPGFVRKYEGRLINIHPSLLPKYPGLNTHRRAIDDGAREHGATVHFVTETLDGGPIILQGKVAVDPADSEESLAEKVHAVEHRIFPEAIAWFAEGRLRMAGDGALLDNERIQ